MLTMSPETYRPHTPATPDGAHLEQTGINRNEIKTRLIEEKADLTKIEITDNQDAIGGFVGDEAGFEGKSPRMYTLKPGAGVAEVAYVIRETSRLKSEGKVRGIVPFGTKSSLTGASVPDNDVLLNMQELTGMGEIEADENNNHYITVEPGVTFKALNKKLKEHGLFFPSAPTHDEATVGGGASTHNGGALCDKYGQFEAEGIEMVLSTGEVIYVNRGEVLAKKGENLELIDKNGLRRLAPVPTYILPDVPKKSGGYNNDTNADGKVDLINMLVGSEGTLGIITKVKLRVLPEPPTAMALVICENDTQMYKLNRLLEKQHPEFRETRKPGGISAVEYIGAEARTFIEQEGPIKPPGAKGNALVLVQMEVPEGDYTAYELFMENCRAAGIEDEEHILGADAEDPGGKARFIALRESVPQTSNRVQRNKGIMNIGTDLGVRPDDLEKVSTKFDNRLDAKKIRKIKFGHANGNEHVKVLADTQEQAAEALGIVIEVCEEVIDDDSIPCASSAEHGVGIDKKKQRFLRKMVGDKGIAEMRAFKQAFDPQGIMAPGNIFPPEEPLFHSPFT